MDVEAELSCSQRMERRDSPPGSLSESQQDARWLELGRCAGKLG